MKKISILLLMASLGFVFPVTCGAQVITTFAGTISGGYTGDHSQATAAELKTPSGVSVDKYGNVFITDQNASCVRMVDTNGIITSVVSNQSISATGYSGDGGPATAAYLNWPEGLGIDDSGNLYIADQFNNVIRKVTKSTGIITTVAGNHSLIGFAGDGGQATAASLWHPADVAVDRPGNIYFVDQDNSVVRKVTAATGIITTIAGVDTSGYSGDGGPATLAKLNFPQGIAADSSGNVFIADYSNNRIRKVNAVSGIITTVAGNGSAGYSGDGGPATAAEIYNASAVAIDDTGNLYISDYYNSVIRKVSAATGFIRTIAGDGVDSFCCDCHPAVDAAIAWPQGVAVSKKGDVFIADFGNSRVRKVSEHFICPALEIKISAAGEGFDVVPNPSTGQFAVHVADLEKNEKVEIYDMLGKKQYESELNALYTEIDCRGMVNGIYLISVFSGGNYYSRRLTVFH